MTPLPDTLDGIRWKDFAAAILNPDAPGLEAATKSARDLVRELRAKRIAVAGGVTGAALAEACANASFLDGAWESMTGRAGAEWLLDDSAREPPARLFLPSIPIRPVVYGTDRLPSPGDLPQMLSERPLDLETMAAVVGADRGNLLAAEAAALEACERMRPWGVGVVRRVAWSLVRPTTRVGRTWDSIFFAPVRAATRSNLGTRPTSEMGALRDEVVRAMGVGAGPKAEAETRLERSQACAVTFAAGWLHWRRARDAGITVWSQGLYARTYSDKVAGVPFRSLPDPIDPLLRVMGLGYDPIDVRGNVVVLGVPLPAGTGPIGALSDGASIKEAQRRYGDSL